MKGHIRERSPGHWSIVLDVPDPQTGKRRRKWHSFKGTKREAQIESARLISVIQGGSYVEPSKTTISSFLESWIEHMRSQISPKSHARYSELARKNIAPLLGSVVLTKLKPVRNANGAASKVELGACLAVPEHAAVVADPVRVRSTLSMPNARRANVEHRCRVPGLLHRRPLG
jgi:hypothetical protein